MTLRLVAAWPVERLMGLGLLTVALIAALILGPLTWHGLRSASWPTAPGVVTDSRVTLSLSSGTTRYWAHVEAAYTVMGRPYRTQRRTYRSSESAESAVRGAVARYPEGRTVRVHYDPAVPARAVLEPGTDPVVFGAFALTVLVTLLGAAITLSTLPVVATTLQRRRPVTARPQPTTQRGKRASRRT